MSNAKKVTTSVPAQVDELDLRVNIPLQQARRLLEEDSKKGARNRSRVREAAKCNGRLCPIEVIPGAAEPYYTGRAGGHNKKTSVRGWSMSSYYTYRPSTLKVTVGSEWVLKHLEQ